MLSIRSFLLLVLKGRPDDSLYHHDALTNIANNLPAIKVDETTLSALPKQPIFTTLVYMKSKNPIKITPPEASTPE